MKIAGYTEITDYRTGKILVAKKNLITTLGKTRTAELLGGVSSDFISAMAVGDLGAPPSSPSTPNVPEASDTGLAHELVRTTTLNPTIIGTNQLRFKALFLTTDPISFAGALHAINEAGLFLQDDIQPGTPRMFARNTFPSIPFDPVDREGLIVTWSIFIT